MTKTPYRYTIDGINDEDDPFAFETEWSEIHLTYIAAEAGEDYHSNHDGWEDHWPLELVLYNKHMKNLGRFKIEVEPVPEFWASKVDGNETERGL